MARRFLVSMLCTAAILIMPVDGAATSWKAQVDNAVVALDAHTGERRWVHFPDRLSQATSELHPDLLVICGEVFVEPRVQFVYGLDPATGEPLPKAPPGTSPLASSGTFDQPEVVLANGWRLAPAFDQNLNFLDDKGQVVWTIATGGYPDEVGAWNNTVFWSFSYLSDEGTVYAYEAGESAPRWKFDPNTVVSSTPPLTRPYFRVIGDDLYFGVIDRQSGDLRWHRDPGAFPHDPYPLIHGGLLVVTAGEELAGPRPPVPAPAPTILDRSSGCSVSASGQGSWWGIAALAAALLALRERRRERTLA